jgi:hypothetical protein
LRGSDGRDGQDAAFVVDVELKLTNNHKFYFVFIYSDGTAIETDPIKMPVAQVIQQYIMGGGGGSGGLSSITIEQDGTEIGPAKIIDFSDDFDLTYDPIDERISVHHQSKIEVLDEGVSISDSVEKINFIGDGVSVVASDAIANWASLDTVLTLDQVFGDPAVVDVLVDTSNVSKFSITKFASENISKFDLVNLDTQTTARKAIVDSYGESVVAGMAIEGATIGQSFKMIVFGLYEDPTFSFPINLPLFLNTDSTITSTPISTTGKFLTKVGKSYGDGAVFIDIDDPKGIV